ncbi:MAG: DUF3943 domain-containing protein, partial [Gemmatimonadetes bacterium]|nr:DUF3943 domain-containing protein [Gemmatimonadota bacterium]
MSVSSGFRRISALSALAVLGVLAVPAASAVAQVPADRAGSERDVASDTLAVSDVLFQGIREWSLLAPGMQVMPRDLLDTARPLTPLAVRTPADGEGAPSPAPDADAWGVEKNFGLAAAEVLLSNLAPWIFNEYPRGSYISQMSPRTWWSNLEAGFGWDDNHFSTNMFAHPFQGALYYNAARSNGYSYWASVPFAFAGSLHWECCGETHLMSINDWFNTALGGAALGEMFYRVSSMVLDNTATGSGRGWREVGAAALDPVRGATRLFK